MRVGVLPTTGQAIAACARFALLLLHVHTHGSEHRTHACACIRMSKSGKSGKSGKNGQKGYASEEELEKGERQKGNLDIVGLKEQNKTTDNDPGRKKKNSGDGEERSVVEEIEEVEEVEEVDQN